MLLRGICELSRTQGALAGLITPEQNGKATDRAGHPMTNEYRLKQTARLVAAFKDSHNGELPATAELLDEWVVKLARPCLDGKSPHQAFNTFVQRLTAKDTNLLRQLALDLLQQVAANQTDAMTATA
jgi:hypothetical protein